MLHICEFCVLCMLGACVRFVSCVCKMCLYVLCILRDMACYSCALYVCVAYLFCVCVCYYLCVVFVL